MQTTYSPQELIALKDERACAREELREHELVCFECSHGYPCLEGSSQLWNIESIEEALGWTARAEEQASQEPLEPETQALYWWSDRSTSLDHERDDSSQELDDSPNNPNARPGVIRPTHESQSESNWLDVISRLGDTEATRNAYQAALRIWFPKRNNPHATSDVAIYKTYLTIRRSDYAEAYCSACKARAIVSAEPTQLIATLAHALSHAPEHIRRQVEFWENGRGFTLTGSTAKTTEETVSESFAQDAEYYERWDDEFMRRGELAKATKARVFAAWYRAAASPASPFTI